MDPVNGCLLHFHPPTFLCRRLSSPCLLHWRPLPFVGPPLLHLLLVDPISSSSSCSPPTACRPFLLPCFPPHITNQPPLLHLLLVDPISTPFLFLLLLLPSQIYPLLSSTSVAPGLLSFSYIHSPPAPRPASSLRLSPELPLPPHLHRPLLPPPVLSPSRPPPPTLASPLCRPSARCLLLPIKQPSSPLPLSAATPASALLASAPSTTLAPYLLLLASAPPPFSPPASSPPPLWPLLLCPSSSTPSPLSPPPRSPPPPLLFGPFSYATPPLRSHLQICYFTSLERVSRRLGGTAEEEGCDKVRRGRDMPCRTKAMDKGEKGRREDGGGEGGAQEGEKGGWQRVRRAGMTPLTRSVKGRDGG